MRELARGVVDAEREVARTKLRLRESLQLASETGSRLVTEVRKQATPVLLVAAAVGVVAVAGLAIATGRGTPGRGWRASKQPSPSRQLAREAGIWLLRAAAWRVATALAVRFRDSGGSPSTAASS